MYYILDLYTSITSISLTPRWPRPCLTDLVQGVEAALHSISVGVAQASGQLVLNYSSRLLPRVLGSI